MPDVRTFQIYQKEITAQLPYFDSAVLDTHLKEKHRDNRAVELGLGAAKGSIKVI